jgi:hypothetical protein
VSTAAIARYAELLDDLLARRRAAPNHELDELLEVSFADALNACRDDMTPDEEASIDGIVQERIAREASR